MNLFRSEAHVRNWPHFDPATEEGMLALDELVRIFSMDFFRRRMDETCVSDSRKYVKELFETMSSLGEQKPFWKPK